MILTETARSRNELQVKVSGHANSAPKGQDLVCCAVSVLTQSLGLNAGRAHIYDRESSLKIVMVNNQHNKTLFDAYLASMRVLANQFPDYVTLREA